MPKTEKRKIKGLLVGIGEPRPIEIEDDLEEFYKLLNCRYIDIQERFIGKTCYDFVIDDEGRLDERKICGVSIPAEGYQETICGPFLIFRGPEEGDGKEHSLTKEDLYEIGAHIAPPQSFLKLEEGTRDAFADWVLLYAWDGPMKGADI